MFNLTRYYAALSLVLIVVAAGLLGGFYRHFALADLTSMAEERNVAMTQVSRNSLWPVLSNLIADSYFGIQADEARANPEIASLRESVIELMRDSDIIKVKVYNREGLTVFSTDMNQIGESGHVNPGFHAAIGGSVVSELSHRSAFDAFEGVISNRDVISSYVPIAFADGRVEGVFELYQDVTPLMKRLARTQWNMIAGVFLVLAALYGLLYMVVRRAQAIITRQEAELKHSLRRIEEANTQLDQRVRERTAELQETNRQLQAQVGVRRQAEDKLVLAAKVYESTVEGIVITDAERNIIAVNEAFTTITGYQEGEMLGQTPAALHSGRQGEGFYQEMWHSLHSTGQWKGEIWNRRKSGEIYPEWLNISAIYDEQGRLTHYVGVFSDITALKQSQERLDYLAHHDPLTGLPNRLLFNDRLQQGLLRATRAGGRLALLFIDLDHFKNVNDTLGHEIGDQLLVVVAKRLCANACQNNTLARLGGDEFIVLLEDIVDMEAVARLSERLLQLFDEPYTLDGHELYLSASIGISVFPTDGQDVNTLVRNADTAMYHAKAGGRNRYHFYTQEMTAYAAERMMLEAALRHSIEFAELEVFYQPQIDSASGRLVGAEALVRWRHPEMGLVSPGRFIPLAEDNGFIVQIGEWVLREACRQAKAWRDQGFMLPKVSVNLSVKQLERPNVVDVVAGILAETGLPARCLELEITESIIMGVEDAFDVLEKLRELDVQLSVDDFGTGYSSLNYLKMLPVQKLKIDRSFIIDLDRNDNSEAIVRAVIGLARNLGLHVIAEGVETQLQLDFLKREGCSEIQGFIYGRPVPADDFHVAWSELLSQAVPPTSAGRP